MTPIACARLFSITSKSMSKSKIISADHTGITVSNLERSLAFWRDVLGFEFSHSAHQTGGMAAKITGVTDAEIKLAVVKAPGGHKIELLEYLAPPDRKKDVDLRPCDVGHVHVAFTVENLEALLEKIARVLPLASGTELRRAAWREKSAFSRKTAVGWP